MKVFIPTFFFVIGAVLMGVGAVFHYKDRNNYGEYFLFAGVSIFLAVLFS